MSSYEPTISWKLARNDYEEILANGGNFLEPRLADMAYELAWKGVEWPCLLFVLLYLAPSIEVYSPRKAPRLIQLLLDNGFYDSARCLAEYLVIHMGGDNPAALEAGMALLHSLASVGHTPSQHLLALFLFDGVGTEPDPAEGLRLLTEAAEANDSEALLALAFCYFYGEKAPLDRDRGFRYARRAEALGNKDAALLLLMESDEE